MSSVEKAIQKLTKIGGANPAGADDHGTAQVGGIDHGGNELCVAITDILRKNHMISPATPTSGLAEEYRRIKRPLLTNMLATGHDRIDHANLILVTSSLSGEGKTFSSINLAVSLAMELDRTVVLIDADIHRPAISQMFGVDDHLGLTDVLAKQVDLGRVLLKTDMPKLRLLPVGIQEEHLSELLGSNHMQALVTELETRYHDRIMVFDSPPLLGASDAVVLGGLVGQIAVVVEADKTPKNVLVEALTALHASEDQMLGLIYNKNRAHRNARYYSGYYSSGQ